MWRELEFMFPFEHPFFSTTKKKMCFWLSRIWDDRNLARRFPLKARHISAVSAASNLQVIGNSGESFGHSWVLFGCTTGSYCAKSLR